MECDFVRQVFFIFLFLAWPMVAQASQSDLLLTPVWEANSGVVSRLTEGYKPWKSARMGSQVLEGRYPEFRTKLAQACSELSLMTSGDDWPCEDFLQRLALVSQLVRNGYFSAAKEEMGVARLGLSEINTSVKYQNIKNEEKAALLEQILIAAMTKVGEAMGSLTSFEAKALAQFWQENVNIDEFNSSFKFQIGLNRVLQHGLSGALMTVAGTASFGFVAGSSIMIYVISDLGGIYDFPSGWIASCVEVATWVGAAVFVGVGTWDHLRKEKKFICQNTSRVRSSLNACQSLLDKNAGRDRGEP